MKNAARLFLVALVMFIFAGQLHAQTAATSGNKEVKKESTAPATQSKFVDANKNGICDNWEANHKEGKNCQGNPNCKGKNCADCCGKVKSGCQSTCKGPGQGTCGKGQGNGCQHRHGQCQAKSDNTGNK
jgi:hypothetical protein